MFGFRHSPLPRPCHLGTKHLVCALAVCVLVIPASASAGNPPADAITGIWLNSAKDGYVQIYRTKAGTYAGQIVGDTDGVVADDVHNPDPAQRDESLLGKRIFYGFEYNGKGYWEDGHIYNPRNGKTYSAWLGLTDDGKLKVHGYIGFSLFGATRLFTRVTRNAKGVFESALVKTGQATAQKTGTTAAHPAPTPQKRPD